jgi:hypothetical protein
MVMWCGESAEKFVARAGGRASFADGGVLEFFGGGGGGGGGTCTHNHAQRTTEHHSAHLCTPCTQTTQTPWSDKRMLSNQSTI